MASIHPTLMEAKGRDSFRIGLGYIPPNGGFPDMGDHWITKMLGLSWRILLKFSDDLGVPT